MSHKNFITIDSEMIEIMCTRYRAGTTIDTLMLEFGYGRNKIVRTLKEALGIEYVQCGKQIRREASRKAGKSNLGRKNPHTPEWNAKIATAHIGLRHTDKTKALLSQRIKERELDPTWQVRKPEITRKIVEGKRSRGYFEIHSKRHGDLMRARERELHVMSKRAKDMWKRGAYTYGDDGIKRSKLEKRVYAAILKYYPNAQHTFPIYTSERSYYYDVFIPSLNTIIEINGDFWHCNPTIKCERDWNLVRNVVAVRAADDKKRRVAMEHGYHFITVWENNLRLLDDTQIINICINSNDNS